MSKSMRYGIYVLSLCLLQACGTVSSPPALKTEVEAKPVVIRPTPPISLTPPARQPAKPVQITPMPDIRGFRQKTYATWYNITEHGNPTANGDVYDYYAMTAAHQNLPFGSQVRVRDLTTGRNIVVTINDRQNSPYIKLSIFAAKQLGVWGKAQPMVSIEGLSAKRLH